jgi:hypothetical protein
LAQKPRIKKPRRTDDIYINNFKMLQEKHPEIQKKHLPIYWSKNKEIVLFDIPTTPEI